MGPVPFTGLFPTETSTDCPSLYCPSPFSHPRDPLLALGCHFLGAFPQGMVLLLCDCTQSIWEVHLGVRAPSVVSTAMGPTPWGDLSLPPKGVSELVHRVRVALQGQGEAEEA